MMAEHHPLASRYTLLSAHCLISVLCVTNVYNNNNNKLPWLGTEAESFGIAEAGYLQVA